VCLAGFAGTKYYGPHPSTWARGMMGPHQPGGPRAPNNVKTALSANADTTLSLITSILGAKVG